MKILDVIFIAADIPNQFKLFQDLQENNCIFHIRNTVMKYNELANRLVTWFNDNDCKKE